MSTHLTHILDLTAVPAELLPAWWPDSTPLRIPLRRGQHEHEYDVADDLLPPGWLQAARRAYPEQHDRSAPCGISASRLAPILDRGARLLELEDA